MRTCPQCDSEDVRVIGTADTHESVSGWDSYVYACDECFVEWEREKGSERVQVMEP